MAFDTRSGTRGTRQPKGPVARLMNRLMASQIRRKKVEPGQVNSLVLNTVGAKSGAQRQTPVVGFPGPDDSWLIVASAAGATGNPAWYYNLAAHPDQVRVEQGGRSVAVVADQLAGADREQAWQQIVTASPRFADYQTKTDRELPVIRLTPRQG
jgi:deazaflavin-dependent oxidoreductase (nitroreductase family)